MWLLVSTLGCLYLGNCYVHLTDRDFLIKTSTRKTKLVHYKKNKGALVSLRVSGGVGTVCCRQPG